MGFDERVHDDEADALGLCLLDDDVLIWIGEAALAFGGHQEAAVAPVMDEEAGVEFVAGDAVELHKGGEAAVYFVGRVLEIHQPDRGAVMDVFVDQGAPGGEADGGGEGEGGFTGAALCGEDADEAAEQPGAEQPLARRDGVRVRQWCRGGAQFGLAIERPDVTRHARS